MVTLRDVNEDVDKGCIRYKKLPTTQVENLHVASHFTQHKTFSALNYAQDFGNRVKESLKRTTNLKWATLTNCPMSNTFMPLIALSTMSLPLVHDKRRWSWDGGGLDRELSTSLTTNYKKRINSRWRGIFSTSVMGLCHGICYLFKKLKRFFCVYWIPKRPKIMAQFGYLRLYFDIDIVSRRLLRWIARIENGLKLEPPTRYRTHIQ